LFEACFNTNVRSIYFILLGDIQSVVNEGGVTNILGVITLQLPLDSMEQSSSEANSHLYSQEIPHLSWNLKVLITVFTRVYLWSYSSAL
jgi:hypothetical protein